MKRIISVSLAVLCLVILVFQIEVNQQNEAWALSRPNFTPNNFNGVMFTRFIPNSNGATQYLAIGNFTSGQGTANNAVINIYNANNTALIRTISFGSALGTIDSGHSWTLQSISCDKSGSSQLCAMSFTPSLSVNSIVILFDANAGTVSNNSTRFAILTGAIPIVNLFNDGTQTHVYVEYRNSGLGQTHVLKLAINTTQSLTSTSNRLIQQADVISNVDMPNLVNSDTGIIANGANAGQWIMFSTGSSINLWSLNSQSRVCGGNTDGVAPFQKTVDFVSDATGNYWLTSGASGKLYKSDFACSISNVDFSSQDGNSINAISHNGLRNEIYLVGGNNQMLVVNETTISTTILASYGSITDGSIWMGTNIGTFQSNNPFVAIGGSGHPATVYMFYWGGIGTGGSSGGAGNTCNAQSGNPSDCVGQIDCSNPANVNLALCFINQNPRNNNGFSGTGGMLNASVTTLSCSIGLVKCVFDSNGNGTPINGNVQTNGVGYLIAIIGLAILISIFWVASDHDLRNIPTFVWFIGVLGLLGALVALQWLDPTFFIVAIIAVVGLAAAKARGLFDSF